MSKDGILGKNIFIILVLFAIVVFQHLIGATVDRGAALRPDRLDLRF